MKEFIFLWGLLWQCAMYIVIFLAFVLPWLMGVIGFIAMIIDSNEKTFEYPSAKNLPWIKIFMPNELQTSFIPKQNFTKTVTVAASQASVGLLLLVSFIWGSGFFISTGR